MGRKLINELGNRYGLLIVKELTKDKNGRTAWLCECDCGNTTIVRGPDLRSGKRTSCGMTCKVKINPRFIDLTGRKIDYLTVLYRNKELEQVKNKERVIWHCKCDCGKEIDIQADILMRKNNIHSCGCYTKKYNSNRMAGEDLTGHSFGLLTVLEKFYDENGHLKYHCQCQCGTKKDYFGYDLRSKKGPKSCGCLLSYPEFLISNYLQEMQITFKKQQTFPDLKSDKGRVLRFDFSIIKNDQIIGLIEYQGDQHFKSIEYYGGEEQFYLLQKHDKMKNEYAHNHNIPLLYLTKDNNLQIDLQNFIKEINFYEI